MPNHVFGIFYLWIKCMTNTIEETETEGAPMGETIEAIVGADVAQAVADTVGTEEVVIEDVGGSEEVVVEPQVDEYHKAFCVKSLGNDRIGGRAIMYGDETRRDYYKEYFDDQTEDIPALFEGVGALPYLVEHATDDSLFKTSVVAIVDKFEERDGGWWWEAKIKEHELYKQHVQPLIERETLYTSTGTLPGAKRVNKSTGHIGRWPVAEVTGTTKPAEYRMLLERPVEELRSYYKSVGLDLLESETNEETSKDETRGVEEMRLKTRINQSKLKLQLSRLS